MHRPQTARLQPSIAARLVRLRELSGSKTRFYTVHLDGRPQHELADFFDRHREIRRLGPSLDNLHAWFEQIARVHGALPAFFRHETLVSALPPKRFALYGLPWGTRCAYQEGNNLRLYSIRLNEHVVILLNGGEKTCGCALDCPNVRPYFLQAQCIGRAVDRALRQGELDYNRGKTDLCLGPEFELMIS